MPSSNLYLHIIPRKNAKALGLNRYFTGKPCKYGHVDIRVVSTGFCLECRRAHGRKSNAERRKSDDCQEYMREYLGSYENKNRKEIQSRYYQKNLDKERKRAIAKRNNNKDYYREKCAERRAKKALAVPKWFESDKVSHIYKMARELGLEVDHVVPLQSDLVCGLHCWDNLQLLDRATNAKKSNTYWPDM